MDLPKRFSHLQKLNRLTGLVWAHRGDIVFQNTPEITMTLNSKRCDMKHLTKIFKAQEIFDPIVGIITNLKIGIDLIAFPVSMTWSTVLLKGRTPNTSSPVILEDNYVDLGGKL